jgi:hypothetical protein
MPLKEEVKWAKTSVRKFVGRVTKQSSARFTAAANRPASVVKQLQVFLHNTRRQVKVQTEFPNVSKVSTQQ